MKHLMITLLLFGLVTGLGGLAACGGPILRDDYMGKSVLQPETLAQPVERDQQGNPILE